MKPTKQEQWSEQTQLKLEAQAQDSADCIHRIK